MDRIDSAIDHVNNQRAEFGALTHRLTFAVNSLAETRLNHLAANSVISDVNYERSISRLARLGILQEAATAMLAQANQYPALVLSLLR